MTSILISWARMALLAVPFADPFLIGLVETPQGDARYAADTGHAGVIPETSAGGAVPARPNPSRSSLLAPAA